MPLVKFRGKSYNLTDDQLFHEFSVAIENVLGKGTSKLIFKTIELVYKINYEVSLSSSMDGFEKHLKMILGDRTTDLIFQSVVSYLEKYRMPANDDDRK